LRLRRPRRSGPQTRGCDPVGIGGDSLHGLHQLELDCKGGGGYRAIHFRTGPTSASRTAADAAGERRLLSFLRRRGGREHSPRGSR
jgi:hypothetical protein